jgi:predicted nucleic acid-binding protein
MDASVGIKLFLPEAGSEAAQELINRHAAEPEACAIWVPDLFHVECANILWKAVGRGRLSTVAARNCLEDLGALRLNSVPTRELVGDALGLALKHGTSVYDATYAALAVRLGLPLVTADQRLREQLSGSPVKLHSLPMPAVSPP